MSNWGNAHNERPLTAVVSSESSPSPTGVNETLIATYCDELKCRLGAAEPVELDLLVSAMSPRTAGVNEAHVQLMVEAQWPLPPILVHRPTMQIIDGCHRVAAAIRLGMKTIDSRLVDGSADAAFVVAVRANVTHGLPLSLADRRAAAVRILETHRDWSDRTIASSIGLSPKTVRALRCATGSDPDVQKRLGRDGRLRPVSAAAGRQVAAELIARRPDASLREIAAEAGISPGTVRDVRLRLARGAGPVPGADNPETSCPGFDAGRPVDVRLAVSTDVRPVLAALSNDPALRMTAAGRGLIRWLHGRAVNTVDSSFIAASLPNHCIYQLVEFATRCSDNWARIARELGEMERAQDVPSVAEA